MTACADREPKPPLVARALQLCVSLLRAPLVGGLEVPEEVQDEEGADDDVVEVADRREHHEPRLVKRRSSNWSKQSMVNWSIY